MGLSTTEILVIVIIILVLFGAKKIPELARSLGRASYEFKKAKEDILKETRELADAAENAAENADKTDKNDNPQAWFSEKYRQKEENFFRPDYKMIPPEEAGGFLCERTAVYFNGLGKTKPRWRAAS